MSIVKKPLEPARKLRRPEEPEEFGKTEAEAAAPNLVDVVEPPAPREIKDIQYTVTRTVPIDMQTMIRQRLISSGLNAEIVESYKLLRTHILQKTHSQNRNVLMITSPLPDEGKTLTAINLAISLSQELAQTVLLVDLDLRFPSMHRYFGFEVDKGLVDYLEGRSTIPELLIHPQGLDRLVLLPGGRPTEWASELIRSPRMLQLVPELKNFYPDRYVLFDLPPMLPFADALSFAPLVDGIILVVAARTTPSGDLKRCQEMLKDHPVLGYVFNKVEDLNQARYYRYGKEAQGSWFSWFKRGGG